MSCRGGAEISRSRQQMGQWAGQGQTAAPLSGRAGGRQRRQPGRYQYRADAPYGASATYWDGAPVPSAER
ncbi:hypothetical protein [Mycolicibacterium mucogenicum]|uniref:hypothetical protein n=1 Tax=Mycolicibacterium mucogenicum TaxID=56689 RepID=UPI001F180123|nr:hypothetical protein [Mycolicibacterium mucogenicum]